MSLLLDGHLLANLRVLHVRKKEERKIQMKMYKRIAVATMAAVLTATGVSVVSTNTTTVANAAVNNYNITIKKGNSVKLSSIVSANVVRNTNLKDVANSNNKIVAYNKVKTFGMEDGMITGLKAGTAKLSFYKIIKISGVEKTVYYTVTVTVKS